MRFCDENGNELTAADVLDPEELDDYYRQRAEDFRTGRRHVARYWPNEDTDQAMYEVWVMRDA